MPASDARIAAGDLRRKAIMKFLRQYVRKNGVSPSVQEITDAVGLASKSATIHHLNALEAAGEIKRKPGKYRTIRLL